MKRLLGLLLAGLVVCGCEQRSGESGWTRLIEGRKGMENWAPVGDANWRAEDGAIVADKGKGGHLVSKKAYTDFQIRAEFWADHNTNSGVFLRITNPMKITAVDAYEVNIFDQRPAPEYGTGAIVNYAKVSPMPKAGGKWNTYEITAKGDQLTVVLNGIETVSVRNGKNPQGPFSLQFGNIPPKDLPGGAIKWRKAQIPEL